MCISFVHAANDKAVRSTAGSDRVVDAAEVMQLSDKAQALQKGLEKKVEECVKKDTEEKKKIELARKNLDDRRSTMSPQAQQREETEIVKMTADYETKRREMEYELNAEAQRVQQELFVDLKNVADSLRERFGCGKIIEKNTGQILSAAPELDITKDAIKSMNTVYAESKTKNAAVTKTAKA